MKALYIDTSSADVSISLLDGTQELRTINENIPNKHSIYTVNYINKVLKDTNTTPEEIQKIYVVNGPGSFTGIRIGVTIAKTFAYLRNIKVVPISTLKALSLTTTGKTIMSLIDFHHGHYYLGLYDENHNEILPEKYASKEEVLSLITKYKPTIVSSEPLTIDKITIPKYTQNITNIVTYYENKPSIHPHKLQVNYLKEPQAVEEKNDNRERK